MRTLKRAISIVIAVILMAAIVAGGSLVCVFLTSRDEPEEIFIFGYAFVAQRDDEEKMNMWLVRRTDCKSLSNGDGVVYYDNASYYAANAMSAAGGETVFFEAGDFSQSVLVDDGNIVGKIIAVWQQK